jgi:trans-2,3-dihydro-3-hydroxyanthranilate isomerase
MTARVGCEVMKRRYVTADVFTKEMFGGNPVAVVLDAEGLSTAQMQAIALEFNYGETTFVLPPRDPTHTAHVRIFTARAEVPFAGHPNVGTAFLLAREREAAGDPVADAFVFEEAAGLVPLTLIRDRGVTVGAELRAPEPLSVRSQVSCELAAQCLSLPSGDITMEAHPPQVLSVGLPFLVVELASRDALRAAKPNLTAYQALLPLDGADGIYAYTARDREASSAAEVVLHARMFAPFDGTLEDPATGSATAATIARLAQLRPSVADRRWRVHQGVDMGRPSLLLGRTTVRNGDLESVHVGGTCVAVMEGTFTLVGDGQR